MRPNWTHNCTDFNSTMELITADTLKAFIPGAEKELLPNTQMDLILGTYITNETKKAIVDRGENHFYIKNNIIDALSTFSFEILSFSLEERYKREVWKVFRQGVASIRMKGEFKQMGPTVFRFKVDPEIKNLIISNFKDEFTEEEDFIKASIKALVAVNPEGIDLDLAPLLKLAPCFGLDENTFEASIEGNHIVLSIDRYAEGVKDCDITNNMAS